MDRGPASKAGQCRPGRWQRTILHDEQIALSHRIYRHGNKSSSHAMNPRTFRTPGHRKGAVSRARDCAHSPENAKNSLDRANRVSQNLSLKRVPIQWPAGRCVRWKVQVTVSEISEHE